MGWGSGSEVARGIIRELQEIIPDKDLRREVYKTVIRNLENADWDTQSDCMGEDPVFDRAIKELHPKWEWD